MALLDCDRPRTAFLLLKAQDELAHFEPTFKSCPISQSSSCAMWQTQGKSTGNTRSAIDDLCVIQRDHTTGLSPFTKRLSVSNSPSKISVYPKRLVASDSLSYGKRQGRPSSIFIPSPKQIHRELTSSQSDNLDKSPKEQEGINNSPTIFLDGISEFDLCEQCSKLHLRSLDLWMDHLGVNHPIPKCWPSSRANKLTEAERTTPYSAVVGTNKKRKTNAVPRPLNSFMIFAQYLRRIVLHWLPDAPNVHISQRVGQLWRKLNPQMREQYAAEAYRLQHLHSIEFPHYKYQPKKRIRNEETGGAMAKDVHYYQASTTKPDVIEAPSPYPDSQLSTSKGDQHQRYLDSSANTSFSKRTHTFSSASPLSKNTHSSRNGGFRELHFQYEVNNHILSKSTSQRGNFVGRFTSQADKLLELNDKAQNGSWTKQEIDNGVFVEMTQADKTLTLLVSGDENIDQHQLVIPTPSPTQSEADSGSLRQNPASPRYSNEVKEPSKQTSVQLLNENSAIYHLVNSLSHTQSEHFPSYAYVHTSGNFLQQIPLETLSHANTEHNDVHSAASSLSSFSPASLETDYLSYSNTASQLTPENKIVFSDTQHKDMINENLFSKFHENSTEGLTTTQLHQTSQKVVNCKTILAEVNGKYTRLETSLDPPVSQCIDCLPSLNKLDLSSGFEGLEVAFNLEDISAEKLDNIDETTLFNPAGVTNRTDVDEPGKISNMGVTQVNEQLNGDPTSKSIRRLIAKNPLPSIESWTFGVLNNMRIT